MMLTEHCQCPSYIGGLLFKKTSVKILNHAGWEAMEKYSLLQIVYSRIILLWGIVTSYHFLGAQASASVLKAQTSGTQKRRTLMPSLPPFSFSVPTWEKGMWAEMLYFKPAAYVYESRIYFVGGVTKENWPERCAQECVWAACVWDSARIWVPGLCSLSTVICTMKPEWAQHGN